MYSTEFIALPFLPPCLAYHYAALEYFQMLKYINSIWKRDYKHVRFPLTSLIIDCTLLLSECIIINLRAFFPLREAGCLCTAQIQSAKVRLCEFADCFSHINKAIVLEVRAFHFMLRMHGNICGMLLCFMSRLLTLFAYSFGGVLPKRQNDSNSRLIMSLQIDIFNLLS